MPARTKATEAPECLSLAYPPANLDGTNHRNTMEIQGFRDKGVLADLVSGASIISESASDALLILSKIT